MKKKNPIKGCKQYGSPDAPPRNQELEHPTASWSIKNGLRHIGAQHVDPTDKNAVRSLITRGGKKKPTMAEVVAARLYTEAAGGNVGAARTIIEHIDGKPPQAVNIGGQPGNPIRTVAAVAPVSPATAEEAYRRMLDGDNA